MRQAIIFQAIIALAAADASMSWAEVDSKGFVQQEDVDKRMLRKEIAAGGLTGTPETLRAKVDAVVPQAHRVVDQSEKGIQEAKVEFLQLVVDYEMEIEGLEAAEEALEENKKALESFENGKQMAVKSAATLRQEEAALQRGADAYQNMGDATPVEGSPLEAAVEEAQKDSRELFQEVEEVKAERAATAEEEQHAQQEAKIAVDKVGKAVADKRGLQARLQANFDKVGAMSHTKTTELLVMTNEALKAMGGLGEDPSCDPIENWIEKPAEVNSNSNTGTSLSSNDAIELTSLVQSSQKDATVSHHKHRQVGNPETKADMAIQKTEGREEMEKSHEQRIKMGIATCDDLLEDFKVLRRELDRTKKVSDDENSSPSDRMQAMQDLAKESKKIKCEQEALLLEVGIPLRMAGDDSEAHIVQEAEHQLEAGHAVRGCEQIGCDEPVDGDGQEQGPPKVHY